jgi:hypothetical protein
VQKRHTFGGLGCTAGEEISTDEGKVGQQLTHFGVGENEGEDGTEVSNGWREELAREVFV